MNSYALFFRMDITTPEAQPTPEQMETYMQQWGEWISGIEANNQIEGGTHLSKQGRVLRQQSVMTDGPYAEKNESVAGYIVISAKNINDATAIANSCPILQGKGTSVEIRQCVGM
jgi:hypothetical protein